MRSHCLPTLVAILCSFAVFSSGVFAHHGGNHPAWEVDEFENEAFMAGLTHPVTGADHLLAIVATGVLAGLVRRGLLIALVSAAGLGMLHGGASSAFAIGLSLGTATAVLLVAGVARALKALPRRVNRLAKSTT